LVSPSCRRCRGHAACGRGAAPWPTRSLSASGVAGDCVSSNTSGDPASDAFTRNFWLLARVPPTRTVERVDGSDGAQGCGTAGARPARTAGGLGENWGAQAVDAPGYGSTQGLFCGSMKPKQAQFKNAVQAAAGGPSGAPHLADRGAGAVRRACRRCGLERGRGNHDGRGERGKQTTTKAVRHSCAQE
jgi:hypothetical protein